MIRIKRQVLTALWLLLIAAPQVSGAHRPTDEFAVKGLHIDMRTQVMTMQAMKTLVTAAAAEGINTVIVEWEATFPFDRHAVLCNPYAYTEDEVRDFVAHCTSLGVDAIPLQNCFGHCEYILRHSRYAALREDRKEISQICPLRVEQAVPVFREIFGEITRLHTSQYVHIGADETRLLGHCSRCAAKAAGEGVSKLFVDYVEAMCRIVTGLGKTPVIWGDMIMQYPEAVGRLPKELIIVDWNYGWEPNHFGDIRLIREAGITVWGATSLRSSPDNIYLTQWDKHLNNLSTFIPYARRNGYRGIINTSWSTSGQYGYTYDNAWEIIDMQPVRQAYPLSGFDVLQRAYATAVNDSAPLDPAAFVRRYAGERFGFGEEGQDVLERYFLTPQQTAANGMDVRAALDDCRALRERMERLRPAAAQDDFEQLRLMLDIRIHYLRFKLAEELYESDGFDASQRGGLAARLKTLLDEGDVLRERFVELNRNYLKNPAQYFGQWAYPGKLRNIYDALSPDSQNNR